MLQQGVEEAAGDKGIDADAQHALFAARLHARCRHGAVEPSHCLPDFRHETVALLGHPDAARVALEQHDAKVGFKHLHTLADAGLAGAQR